jgi:class 3 adenylate cyclase
MDVAAWLRGLGLERYEAAFRENDVDAEVLPELTADDLISIGVISVGHRRRLLAAIAALGAAPPAAAVMAAPRDAPPQADAERRQLTVMFCDLVGSTALSARLDPEDLREVIAAYHLAVSESVARFDGFVAKYMGDGVLVYFGYPRAHEDDAERAVRAGLGVIDVVGRLDVKSVKLQARVGIATGLVVVVDLIGEGSAQELSVIGETPNLAARLQALAEPDAVVIAAGTRRLVGHLFEYRDLGAGQRLAEDLLHRSQQRAEGSGLVLARYAWGPPCWCAESLLCPAGTSAKSTDSMFPAGTRRLFKRPAFTRTRWVSPFWALSISVSAIPIRPWPTIPPQSRRPGANSTGRHLPRAWR